MNRLFLGIIATTLLSACGEQSEPVAAPPDLAAGQALADKECSACHGMDGRGLSDKIPNLAAQPADYLVEAMHAYAEGRRHHAALQDLFSGFTDTEIRNIAGWYSSLPPLASDAGPDLPSGGDSAAYVEGRQVASICAECHGERGFSTTPGVPSLAGQQPIYLIVSTQEYARGERGHVEKEAMLEGLDQVDIEKMAMYFAAQAPSRREPPPFGDPATGEALAATCGECHGAHGISEEPMVPNLAGQEPTYLVNAIQAYRDHERSHEDMVADLNDEEIEHIAAYYSVQSAGSMTDTGEPLETVVAKCERCHGRDASQSTLVVPNIRGQKRDYLLRVMKEYRDEERANSMMHKMSSAYSDELLGQLADWYASHPPQED